jgi:hypothetical protein
MKISEVNAMFIRIDPWGLFRNLEKILGKGPPVRKRRRKHVGKSLSP